MNKIATTVKVRSEQTTDPSSCSHLFENSQKVTRSLTIYLEITHSLNEEFEWLCYTKYILTGETLISI